jgi:TatD DNase family protein
MLIDTHVHLDYSDFDSDRPAVIDRAREAGVTEMISIGTRLDSSARALELAENFPAVWATVGVHPTEVEEAPDNYLAVLRQLAQSRRVVGVGEIGLDYHHLPSQKTQNPTDDVRYKETQERMFREQLDLAVELSLNVVIHQRDSWEDCVKVLRDYTGRVRGVFHCFGGTLAQAQEMIALGHLVSFTGIVTFKNAPVVQATAQDLPEDQFMVETDCPYLAPVPHRGQRCEPWHTRLVAEKIAALRRCSVEAVAETTTATARRFFNFTR